jgi:hypothetical protein
LSAAGLLATHCAPSAGQQDSGQKDAPQPKLITTLGPVDAAELGMIVPHEHVFVDLRTWDQPGYGQADAEDMIALMAPELETARAAGRPCLGLELGLSMWYHGSERQRMLSLGPSSQL